MSRVRLAAPVIALAALLGAGFGVMAARVGGGTHETFALPERHGQASWSPGERRAPPFALRDHDGRSVSLASLRRRPVLLTFLDSHCHEQCPAEGRMLGGMLRRMPADARPTLVIVSVNPAGDTPASIRRAMAEWRLAGPWTWRWLRGTRAELARVWRPYGITVDPTTNDVTHGMALLLIDRRGFQRSGYLFPFLPNFVALDLRALARERS